VASSGGGRRPGSTRPRAPRAAARAVSSARPRCCAPAPPGVQFGRRERKLVQLGGLAADKVAWRHLGRGAGGAGEAGGQVGTHAGQSYRRCSITTRGVSIGNRTAPRSSAAPTATIQPPHTNTIPTHTNTPTLCAPRPASQPAACSQTGARRRTHLLPLVYAAVVGARVGRVGEGHAAVVVGAAVQRLLAAGVARRKHRAALAVVHDEGELALQGVEGVGWLGGRACGRGGGGAGVQAESSRARAGPQGGSCRGLGRQHRRRVQPRRSAPRLLPAMAAAGAPAARRRAARPVAAAAVAAAAARMLTWISDSSSSSLPSRCSR
jgi:hypothetical protein